MAQSISSGQLRPILQNTMLADKSQREQAETTLKHAQRTQGYAIALLEIVASNAAEDATVRLVAAVAFKNLVKYGWHPEEEKVAEYSISPSDRTIIKSHLVELMCTVPPQIQAQCSEAISLIAKHDYPTDWDNLLPDLIKKFNDSNPAVVNGVLKTANSIFKSFRYGQRSDALYSVIIYSLQRIQEPLLMIFQSTVKQIDAAGNDLQLLSAKIESLRLICRIFYSLNYQDLPEFFEDNMGHWMEGFSKFLQYKNPILVDDAEESEPSVIDRLQTAIVENLYLYVDKDEEPFHVFLPNFTQLVWQRLLDVTIYPKHDMLAITCIRFISALVKKAIYKELFQDDATLKDIIGRIVVPNLAIREVDEIRFDEDPAEFIATDIEGNESGSRRRGSQELLRDMCRLFEDQTKAICGTHITQMLDGYAQNPAERWQAKDVAIHLMFGISIKTSSQMHGVSALNDGVDVMSFFMTHVFPELQDTNHSARPMLKATALKFVNTFRNQFTVEQLTGLMPLLVHHLASPVVVVHTYAAYTIERILVVKEGTPGMMNQNRQPTKFGRTQLQPFLEGMFTALFKIIDNASLNENEYVMKCLMRSLSITGEGILPIIQIVVEKLTQALVRAAKNPRNPLYNHYMFESIAILIRSVCKTDASLTTAFEELLFPPFQTILTMDVSEFTPYVFQVLAQLLEYRTSASGLGDAYKSLFAPLLSPAIWDRKGNIPALTRLLRAYLGNAAGELFKAGHLKPMLGVFQKLLVSKSTEQHSFDLLKSIITFGTADVLQPYFKTIFQLLLARLQAAKTPRFIRLVTHFFALFVGKYGAPMFFDILNGMQPNLARTMLVQFWIPQIQKDQPTRLDAKTHIVGLTKVLCEAPVLLADPQAATVWVQVFKALLHLMAASGSTQTTTENNDEAVEVEISYDGAFSRLQFAQRAAFDPFAAVTDVTVAFANGLSGLMTSQKNRVQPLVQQALQADPKLGPALDGLMKKTGTTLA